MIWVVDTKYIKDYTLYVKFNDNLEAELDLSDYINAKQNTSILSELKDLSIFKTAKLNSDIDTVVWANGADIAPERLYDLAKHV
jgi:hypothetical protein